MVHRIGGVRRYPSKQDSDNVPLHHIEHFQETVYLMECPDIVYGLKKSRFGQMVGKLKISDLQSFEKRGSWKLNTYHSHIGYVYLVIDVVAIVC